MKTISVLAVGLLAMLMLGCETSSTKPSANSNSHNTTGTTASGTNTTSGTNTSSGTNMAGGTSSSGANTGTSSNQTSGETAADNTGVNKRDRHTAAKTPIDQNENKADVDRTADIRKRVLNHENMSINARNVKIITADGKVTLRGPVDSQEEKDIIEGIAQEVAGKENVDNQIEVAAKDSK